MSKPHRRLIRNRTKCLKCGDIIESTYRHDFKWCSCGNVAVDGGLAYVRRAFKEFGTYEDLNEYEEDHPNCGTDECCGECE